MPSGFGLEISLFDFNVGDRLGGTDEEKKEWISSSLKEDLVNIFTKNWWLERNPDGSRKFPIKGIKFAFKLGSRISGEGIDATFKGSCGGDSLLETSSQSSTTGIIESALTTFNNFVSTGDLATDFCIGNCKVRTAKGVPLEGIAGSLTLEPTRSCDGAELKANADISLGALASLATKGTVKFPSGLGQLGIRSELAIAVGTSGFELKGKGSLLPLPPLSGGNPIVKVAYNVFRTAVEHIELGFSARVGSDKSTEVTFSAGLKPIKITNDIRIEDADKMGLRCLAVIEKKAKGSSKPVTKFGIKVPLRLFDDVQLTGEIYFVPGVSRQVHLKSKMDGWWRKAFGIPYLHVANIVANVGWFVEGFPKSISMFDIGGEGCISGKPEYCDKDHLNYAENSDNRITALAYAGYAANPEKPEESKFYQL